MMAGIFSPTGTFAQQKPESLPTGAAITPLADPGAKFQRLKPGLPSSPGREMGYAVSTAVSPDGNTLLVLTSGFREWYDAKGVRDRAASNEFVFVFDITKSEPRQVQALPVPNAFGGIVWNPSGREFYVGGGVDDVVHTFAKKTNLWTESGAPIPLGHSAGLGIEIKPMVAGVAVTADGSKLVVANYENDSVSIVDLASRKIAAEIDLRPGKSDASRAGTPGGEFPYGVAVRGNDHAYVSSVRDRELVVVDIGAIPRVVGRIALHGQPNKLAVNKQQTRLYVAEDNSDTLAVVDSANDQVMGELSVTAPREMQVKLGGFKGSNPNSVTLSSDEHTAYVTLGGANAIAIVQLSADGIPTEVAGLIPTAWYPNAASLNRPGTILYVVNGKSVAGPNLQNCRATTSIEKGSSDKCHAANQYILQLTKGGLLTAPIPSASALGDLTRRVSEN